MLPIRLLPNWRISLDTGTIGLKDLSADFSCSLLAKIYPFGVVSYNIKTLITSEKGIDFDALVAAMRSIKEEPVIIVEKRKFTASSLAKKVHDNLVHDLTLRKIQNEYSFEPFHRIVTLDQMDGSINLKDHQKELSAIVGLDRRWKNVSPVYVKAHLPSSFVGKYEDQFFAHHQSCTIICPSNPAVQEKFNSYVRKCLRSNYTSIIEAAIVQTSFAKALEKELNILSKQLPCTIDQKAPMLSLLTRINNVDWLLNANYLSSMLFGKHKEFVNLIGTDFDLELKVITSLKALNSFKEKLEEVKKILSISDQIEMDNIVNQLNEISKVSRAFYEKNPLQISNHASLAKTLMTVADDKRNSLIAMKDQYNQFATSPFPSNADMFNLKKAMTQIVLTDYRLDILPKFQDFVQTVLNDENKIKEINEAKRKEGVAVPSAVDTEKALKDAKSELSSVTTKKPLEQIGQEVSAFASKAKPYVETLLKIGKIALTIMGVAL